MAFRTGNLTLSSSGNNSFTGWGFRPVGIEISVCQKGTSGSANGTVNYSEGAADGTRQSTRSIYGDSSGHFSVRDSTNSKCVSHYERVGGNVVEVLSASLGSFDADGITFNVGTPNANYQVNYRAWS